MSDQNEAKDGSDFRLISRLLTVALLMVWAFLFGRDFEQSERTSRALDRLETIAVEMGAVHE